MTVYLSKPFFCYLTGLVILNKSFWKAQADWFYIIMCYCPVILGYGFFWLMARFDYELTLASVSSAQVRFVYLPTLTR